MAGEKKQFNDVDNPELLDIKQNNLVAIVAPVVTDDSASGYAVNSEWIDITADKAYKCVDASVGAAVWKETTQSGGASPLTTKGDLFTYDTGDQRLAVGTDGYILEADSAQATGLKYSKKPWKRSFYGYNMIAASGYAWNGLTNPDLVNAAAATVLYERWRYLAFSGGNSGQEGAYVNLILPSTYAGGSLKITANFTANVASLAAVYYFGITKLTAGGLYGQEVDTEWVKGTWNTSTGFAQIQQTFTFSGTGIAAEDSISIMVYRDPDDAGDTTTADTYLNTWKIEEI